MRQKRQSFIFSQIKTELFKNKTYLSKYKLNSLDKATYGAEVWI